mgnify:CR=1 FL=1
MIDYLRRLGAQPIDIVMVLDSRGGRDHRLRVTPRVLIGGVVLLLLTAVLAGWGLKSGTDDHVDAVLASEWRAVLDEQQAELERVRRESDTVLGALTRRFGELQARLLRMQALGKRVAHTADLDPEEFDLARPPSLGGPIPEAADVMAMEPPAFISMIEDLSEQVLAREQQLTALESVIGVRRFEEAVTVSGRPVERGWLSSSFGRRVDPFSGKLAWHEGLDFAGRKGDPVTATAAGVVIFAGHRSGYGRLVEINHGNGYVTRYGHNHELAVAVGDLVRRGDRIASMGSSGRSTGPHVHFEVLRDGRPVDPSSYIARGAD